MSQVTIILTDKPNGDLQVAMQIEGDQGTQAHEMSLLFLELLDSKQKPKIITGE